MGVLLCLCMKLTWPYYICLAWPTFGQLPGGLVGNMDYSTWIGWGSSMARYPSQLHCSFLSLICLWCLQACGVTPSHASLGSYSQAPWTKRTFTSMWALCYRANREGSLVEQLGKWEASNLKTSRLCWSWESACCPVRSEVWFWSLLDCSPGSFDLHFYLQSREF